jgi:signal transduction histidine kinase
MAHELRKPLHVIRLATRTLEGDGKDKDRYTGIIDEEIENADRFIKEILAFAHTDTLDKSLYSLEELARKVTEKYRLIADEARVDLTMKAEAAIPKIYMDVIRMEEVLGNLIQNAIDSVDETVPIEGVRQVTIILTMTPDREIHTAIRDTGSGFDESTIDRLFDPYFTTRENGTGLGLSLSYRILMAHGARLELANDERHHGVVRIIFPV